MYLNVLIVSLTVFQQGQGPLLPHYCQMEIQVRGLHWASIGLLTWGYFHFCWLLMRVYFLWASLTYPKHRESASHAEGWKLGLSTRSSQWGPLVTISRDTYKSWLSSVTTPLGVLGSLVMALQGLESRFPLSLCWCGGQAQVVLDWLQ